MATLRGVLVWIVAHPTEIVDTAIKLGVLLSMLVALLPQRAQRWPWIGGVVRVLARLSALTHHDAPGTLKWPGVLRAAEAAVVAEGTPTLAPRSPQAARPACSTRWVPRR